MRAVLQRVTSASVEVDGQVVGRIQQGLMVLLGVAKGDDESDVRYVVDKIRTFRIFSDEQEKMNRSLITLHAKAHESRGPSQYVATSALEPTHQYGRALENLSTEWPRPARDGRRGYGWPATAVTTFHTYSTKG